MFALNPVLQRFDWGSHLGIPELLGFEPDGGPYAEAWWGAHRLAPSTLSDGTPLDEFVAANGATALGDRVARDYGALPYLLKVLSIARPLSIQVHPTMERARAGFAEEEAQAIDLHAPTRTFKDASHKPEMLLAVSELTVLSGFRPVDDLAADLRALGEPCAELLAALESGGLKQYVVVALHGDRSGAIAALARHGVSLGRPAEIAARALAVYPDDPGALVALAMNPVTLAPGEALFTDAGVVHCYIEGLGVEIMANSDNVVRAGLTHKAINIDLLVDLVSFESTPPARVEAFARNGAKILETGADEFALVVVAEGEATVEAGPRIVLAVTGPARVDSDAASSVEIGAGEALFVPASDGELRVATEGLCVVATVGGARG